MAFAQTDNLLSPYRKFLVELSSYISGNDLETLKFAVVDLIPRRKTEDASSGLKLFDILEQDLRISPGNLSLLEDLFKTIGRMDLALKVQYFSKSTLADNSRNNINGTECENLVTDGGGDEAPKCQTAKCVAKSVDFEDVVTDGVGDESESDPNDRMADCVDRNNAVASTTVSGAIQGMLFSAPAQTFRGIEGVQVTPAIPVTRISSTEKSEGSSFAASTSKSSAPAPALTPASAPAGPGPAPVPVPAPSVTSDASAQAGQGRLQHDSIVGPPPRRYVNYLAYQGYSVEIIGGKHYKTPEGEFVELKSGTQYKIHIKNSHAYSCNLDVSIDGYDVGGWVVYGGQELTIERPAYEAKKFTFYRVKAAPKEAGIESGRDENGLVKCVFTPEACLDISVAISGLPHPLEVNIAPDATVGDLKRQIQSQLNAANDPDQLLVLNDKVLPNSSRLSYLVKSPGNLRNLRLVDAELEITVEVSSSERFPVKLRPSKANVIDLMKVIEEKLGIPVSDQEIYHGKTRLSDAPGRSLPSKLICSIQPSVVVTVRYITITVEDMESGDGCIMKVDKRKTLKNLLDEISLRKNMSENEKASVTFYFKGEGLCPSENDQSLSSLGFGSGSKIEMKRFVRRSEKLNDDDEKEAKGSLPHFMEHPEEQMKLSEDQMRESQHYKKEAKGSILSRIWRKVSSPFAGSRPFRRTKERAIGAQTLSGKNNPPPLLTKDVERGHMRSRRVVKHGAKPPPPPSRATQKLEVGASGSRIAHFPSVNYEDPDHNTVEDYEACKPPRRAKTGAKTASLPICITKGMNMVEGSDSLAVKTRLLEFSDDALQDCGLLIPASVALNMVDDCSHDLQEVANPGRVLPENHPMWKAGGTTLQGYSSQHFTTADPIKVDSSKKVELLLRLVAREDETDLVFPKEDFKPLSTLCPPAVPE